MRVQIPGYPGYTIDETGCVLNKRGKEVGYLSSYGYKMVTLRNDDGAKALLVHRLVAELFVDGRTPEKRVVDHIDGDKLNNRAENLRWVSQSENLSAAYYEQDLMPERQKPKAVITRNKQTNECNYWPSIHKAAKALGVAYWHANDAAHGKNYHMSAGGYYWHLI